MTLEAEVLLDHLQKLRSDMTNLNSLLQVAILNLDTMALENTLLRERLERLTHCNAAWMARALKAEGPS